MTTEHSIHIRYLHQDKHMKIKDNVKRYKQYSKSSIYRVAKRTIEEEVVNRRKQNKGRPQKLSNREKITIVKELHKLREEEGTFTSKRLQICSNTTHVCNRSVRNLSEI